VLSQRWPRAIKADRMSRCGDMAIRNYPIWRQFGFDVARNSSIRSADPENPTLEVRTKHEAYRITRCADTAILNSPMLKSLEGGSLWAKISGCSPWSRPLMFGSAESEHPTLTNREIPKEFQPMWSQSTNVTDGQTNRRPRFALKCIVR